MIWIVGVVIGVVALLAIIGVVAFILISRKKKKARAAAIAAGQAPAYGPPPGQPQMQQQYMVAPPGQVGMAPIGQQQHYPPPQENGYYQPMQDGKPVAYPVGGPPQSPPPPQWTPQQNAPNSNMGPPPVSPITQSQRGSLTPSEGAALQDQRAMSTKSPVHTINEIGTNNPTIPPNNLGASPNTLGASPNIVSQQQTGNTISSVSEMSTPPQQHPQVAPPQPAKIQPTHHTNLPASELQ